MPKSVPSPGTVLKSVMDEYYLNPQSLADAISMSPSAMRQVVSGKTKISVATALRLAKYFGTTPVYWLDVQRDYDLWEAAQDKDLAGAVKLIAKAKKKKPPVEKKSAKKTDEPVAAKSRGRKKADEPVAAKPRGRKKAEEPAAAPRTRGRKAAVLEDIPSAPVVTAAPKKRGRPKAAPSAEAFPGQPIPQEPKKRGRKPKAVSADAPVKTPGRRGRKPKASIVAEVEQAPVEESKTHSILLKQDGRIIDSYELPVNSMLQEEEETGFPETAEEEDINLSEGDNNSFEMSPEDGE